MRPRELFSASARSMALAWTLFAIGLILKYVTRTSGMGVRFFAPVLLATFVAYVVVSLALWTNHRWHSGLLARALGAGVVPFGTLWFTRWAQRRRELSGDWRLGRDGSYAYSWNERALAWCSRRPAAAAFVVGAFVAAIGATYWQFHQLIPVIGT